MNISNAAAAEQPSMNCCQRVSSVVSHPKYQQWGARLVTLGLSTYLAFRVGCALQSANVVDGAVSACFSGVSAVIGSCVRYEEESLLGWPHVGTIAVFAAFILIGFAAGMIAAAPGGALYNRG